MRIYIIGNDGITLCREAPAAVNEGEIAVASKEELHAAPLSGKRLLALWNALPGVEKRRTVGDREALIDQLWSAVEGLPDPEPPADAKRTSKQDEVIAMLRRAEGATVDEVASATGWQRHTVRGVFSGTLKKKLGLTLASAKEERGRVYRIAEPASRYEPQSTMLRLASTLAGRCRSRSRRQPDQPAGQSRGPVDQQIAELVDRSTHELRLAWRQLHRTGPPQGLSRDLLIRALANQLQERTHGGASRALRRRLQKLTGEFEKDGVSFDPGIVPKIGTTLAREWRGRTHVVLVREDGFEYEGQPYRSLSVRNICRGTATSAIRRSCSGRGSRPWRRS